MCFHETVHNKCGRLGKSAGQNENVLERGFVTLCLKSVNIKWPALRLDPETVSSSDGKSNKTTYKELSSGLLKVKQVVKLQGYSDICGQILWVLFLVWESAIQKCLKRALTVRKSLGKF